MYPALLVLCSFVLVQVIYLLIFIIGLSKKKVTTNGGLLPVSVIVCAHDELENLKELIPQLLSQDHPEFEVIIVDDRSNDSTFDFLLEETAKDHRLRMVHVNRTPPHTNSKKYALTLGIKAARFEWLLFTDADCRPDGNSWISTMSNQFNDATQFVLGYSPYMKGKGFLNAFIRFDTLMTAIQYVSFAILGNPYMGVGRNLAYRRSSFLGVKGFNNIIAITGGDDDLFVNLHAKGSNTAVCVDRASQTHSKPKTSLKNFIQSKNSSPFGWQVLQIRSPFVAGSFYDIVVRILVFRIVIGTRGRLLCRWRHYHFPYYSCYNYRWPCCKKIWAEV